MIFRVLLVAAAATLSFTGAAAQDELPETTAEPTPVVRPFPSATATIDGVTLNVLFDQIQQGRIGVWEISGEGVTGAQGRYLNETLDYFPDDEGGATNYYGILAIDMDRNPRDYEFQVFATLADGSRVNLPGRVTVTLGGFIRQPVLTLPPDRAYLIDPEVERNEFARLSAVSETYSQEAYWEADGFRAPINSEITSPFGAFRIFNGTVETRHTGWDLRAAVGTPVTTMAAGRVAFAGLMDVRGNYILIDHGYGIYSGYAHLSQVHVTRGQTVTSGQIIGVSGNTGRSGGAHLHWEIMVNGHWIDSVDFMRTWIP
jgi:murein DD-endopeptidase MepM/ murein hydrolase activator NlpD